MKKIGLINYQFSNHNYGAVLQAAALNYYIENKLGYSSEHINFVPSGANLKKRKKLKSLVKRLVMEVGFKEKKITHDSFSNPEVFEEFRLKWLPRTAKTFSTFEELKSEVHPYSHVVVGSDQVWRPSYTGNSSLVYFLAFLDKKIKRVSYAASFGNDTWELSDADTLPLKQAVQKFSSISVRESSGKDICEKVFDVKASHVLDPTLLIGRDFFDKVIGDCVKENKSDIVYYKLDIDRQFESFINSASSDLGYSHKNIYYEQKGFFQFYQPVDSWLYDIRESKLVITDSFHCVCFALLFEKPFVYYPNSNRGLTRLESLLSLLGLEHHIYSGLDDPHTHIKRVLAVDYSFVKSRLVKLRNDSESFLNGALS